MKCLKASSLISIVAAFGAMAAVSAPASAAVTGILVTELGASECARSSGAEPVLSGNGNLYNSSTGGTSVVVCPIFDDDAIIASNGIAGVEMIYTDKSTVGNVSCTLSHVSTNGVTLTNGTAAASTGSTTTGGTLDLLPPSGTTGGRHFVKCTLPIKGGSVGLLTAYKVYITP